MAGLTGDAGLVGGCHVEGVGTVVAMTRALIRVRSHDVVSTWAQTQEPGVRACIRGRVLVLEGAGRHPGAKPPTAYRARWLYPRVDVTLKYIGPEIIGALPAATLRMIVRDALEFRACPFGVHGSSRNNREVDRRRGVQGPRSAPRGARLDHRGGPGGPLECRGDLRDGQISVDPQAGVRVSPWTKWTPKRRNSAR